MKSIYQLIPDMQDYISKNENWYEQTLSLNMDLRQSRPDINKDPRRGLRLSGLGDKCPKALWYSIHHPERAEPLPPHAIFKYKYGLIIEDMALALARLAGHSVTGEQDAVAVDGVLGHRDAVVDGCVLDVKSCNSFAFDKYKNRQVEEDIFLSGNLLQLDGYILGSRSDPLVTVKDKGYILAIDKTLGHMVLYEHELREQQITDRIEYYKSIVSLPSAPGCQCNAVRDRASGRLRLDTKASYSDYKSICFPHLRMEIISGKPVYFIQ
jgi:hypothetical protein